MLVYVLVYIFTAWWHKLRTFRKITKQIWTVQVIIQPMRNKGLRVSEHQTEKAALSLVQFSSAKMITENCFESSF